ncbi:transcriptional regulator [Nocardiopsis sp. HNM0947]|uniref:Transcriptional regulator n=1 Tax=Nocardiopsis coralli TaxID=2772213 RepID=A0ABR9PB65_9ACTN|nr:helix-turn-helix domain-containing protein [Nocardiopsis coralli]MBE3001091.1 transcriptional regulator [Nocardiopsis coralli]
MDEVPRRGAPVSAEGEDELAAELRRRYDAGESIRSLCAATGRSYSYVRRRLQGTGTELRGRGGDTRTA